MNLPDWQRHLIGRLRSQVSLAGHPRLTELLAEVQTFVPAALGSRLHPPAQPEPADLVMPLHLRLPGRELRLFSTIAAFGTPLDATVAELAIETFFPADDATAAALRGDCLSRVSGPW